MNQEPRILVAGIGNIFLGDDAFGCEVIRRCSDRSWPAGVRIVDFGIRGFDLAYALVDGYDYVVLVDATARGGQPGTLYFVWPEVDDLPQQPAQLDAHTMQPQSVLRYARSLGALTERMLLLGCEPTPLDDDTDIQAGISDAVAIAVERAAELVETLVEHLRTHQPTSGELEDSCGSLAVLGSPAAHPTEDLIR